MIKVTSDRSRKLVIAEMSGFLDAADVDRFNADKEAAVTAMGLGSGDYVILINTEGCVIQSQEVVAAFTRVVLDTRFKSKKLAVVRHDNLTRLQTRRILSVRDDAEIFASVEEAEAWLFDVGEQRRVA